MAVICTLLGVIGWYSICIYNIVVVQMILEKVLQFKICCLIDK